MTVLMELLSVLSVYTEFETFYEIIGKNHDCALLDCIINTIEKSQLLGEEDLTGVSLKILNRLIELEHEEGKKGSSALILEKLRKSLSLSSLADNLVKHSSHDIYIAAEELIKKLDCTDL
jgi:hypothetical protein